MTLPLSSASIGSLTRRLKTAKARLDRLKSRRACADTKYRHSDIGCRKLVDSIVQQMQVVDELEHRLSELAHTLVKKHRRK